MPLTYSDVVRSGTTVSPISQDAPVAPECPKTLIPNSSGKLKIEYKKNRLFKKAYIEDKISAEIASYGIGHYHDKLKSAEIFIRNTMRKQYPNAKLWMVGSFAAGIDTHSSDLDFTVEIPDLKEEDNSYEKLKIVKKSFRKAGGFGRLWVVGGRIPVLKAVHLESGVAIDISIDSEDSKRNTQLLNWYGQIDSRFPLLCKAMKHFSVRAGIEGANRGRLNSFSQCLMLISYLQVGVKPAVLPNLQNIFPEINGKMVVEDDNYQKRNLKKEMEDRGIEIGKNKSSLAALFVGFLDYYSKFEFHAYRISVKQGRVLRKKVLVKKGNVPRRIDYIVIEDPFLEELRNCAVSLQQEDYVEMVKLQCRRERRRILETLTIFSEGDSNWRRKCEEEGRENDLKMVAWEEEAFAPMKKKYFDELPWGVKTNFGLPAFRAHPEVFWGERKFQKEWDHIDWPERILCAPDVMFWF